MRLVIKAWHRVIGLWLEERCLDPPFGSGKQSRHTTPVEQVRDQRGDKDRFAGPRKTGDAKPERRLEQLARQLGRDLAAVTDSWRRVAGSREALLAVTSRAVDDATLAGLLPNVVGAVLPRGAYSIVMNARWYGLPDARDGWVYMRIEDDVYRVDYRTMEVLERVTHKTGANWP